MQGLPLEDIEKLYSMPWKERVNVLYYLRCYCFINSCKQILKGRKNTYAVRDSEESINTKPGESEQIILGEVDRANDEPNANPEN